MSHPILAERAPEEEEDQPEEEVEPLTLCAPCSGDADCFEDGLDTGGRCVNFVEKGAFCGSACESAADCPEQYDCLEVGLLTGVVDEQCVLLGDSECQCSEFAISIGAFTNCFEANEAGQCAGQRQCVDAGFTECDAPMPEAEMCNAVDDDCDGAVDEGFSDQDGDGAADCVDPDDDNDKDPDVSDCAPFDPEVSHLVEEKCNGLDDNCDQEVDEEDAEGCRSYYLDVDQDGFGSDGPGRCLCAPSGCYSIPRTGDCQPLMLFANPNAKEACNGVDDDCDGATDEACTRPGRTPIDKTP